MFSKTAYARDTVKASVALAIGLGILGVFVIILGGFRFWEKQDLYNLRFKSVKDLSAGRPVKYGGLDVGRIRLIEVDPEDPRLIRVVIGLNPPMEIRDGVVARIAQKGLVGDYYVFLDPQRTLGAVIPPGSFLETAETVDISQLAALAGDILGELRPRLERIGARLELVLNEDNARKLSALLASTPELIEELRKTAHQVRTDFNQLTTSGRSTAAQADKTLRAMETAVDALKRELEVTLKDFRGGVKAAGALTETMRKAVAQDQAQLEDILANVERISEDTKHLAEKLRERPWELIRAPREGRP